MRNEECRIRFITPSGKEQVFLKEEGHWVQISTRGMKRSCTAEQVLSHLLPALFFGRVTTKIDWKNEAGRWPSGPTADA
jgi:hypothetical protein